MALKLHHPCITAINHSPFPVKFRYQFSFETNCQTSCYESFFPNKSKSAHLQRKTWYGGQNLRKDKIRTSFTVPPINLFSIDAILGMQAAIPHTNHRLPRQIKIVLHKKDVIFKSFFSIHGMICMKNGSLHINDIKGEEVYYQVFMRWQEKVCQVGWSDLETTRLMPSKNFIWTLGNKCHGK